MKPLQQNSYRIPEAPESSAGDDFHVLWTIRKSFELLNFNDDGLKAVTIEGIDPKTALKSDPHQNQLLGVDIAEYYGGKDFNSAKKVVISQLKYSTRRTNENWTFYKLYKGKSGASYNGSIFHRFSQIFQVHLKTYGREAVLGKTSIKFVSNRNFNENQKGLINNIQCFLQKKPTKTNFDTIIRHFPESKDELQKIKESTKLTSIEFTDFFRILNFEDCGTNSRAVQEFENIQAIQTAGIQDYHQYDTLFRTVWKKMLPEAIDDHSNKITVSDFLFCFNMSLDRLLPVCNKFENIEGFVPRKQVLEIIDQIKNSKVSYPICIHGPAGIGKSAIVQQIKQLFPDQSEVLLYDCYGAGTYLNPSDSRHLHSEAILQISNELAKIVGSPYLLLNEGSSHIYMRELKKRIENAIQILRQKNVDSLLIIIIDAADNSITAGEKSKNQSFVTDLLQEEFPEGFRLVLTSRSYRKPSLHLPESYTDIPLQAFDYDETKQHLSLHFPKCTDEDILDFQNLTQGVPRVQSYALGLKRIGITEVIDYLKPNGKTVEDILHERIVECIRKIGNDGEEAIFRFFSTLVQLPRPIPIEYLVLVSNLDDSLITDISIDIWHGLVLNNNVLSFRDEDFEVYIRETYIADQALKKSIAKTFLNNAEKDEYASENLGVALFEAEEYSKLKEVVLNDKYNNLPVDPVRKKRVYIERAKLAIKICENSDDILTFFKLLFICADTAKTEDAINNLIINNVELVASFGETDSLQVLQQSESSLWHGTFHLRLAAIYSRSSNYKESAYKHLNSANDWIEWRQRQDERKEYPISIEDIGFGAEAVLRLFNPQAAIKWIKSWQPKHLAHSAANFCLKNLLRYSEKNEINEWIKNSKLSLYSRLVIIQNFDHFEQPLYDLHKDAIVINRFLSNERKVDIQFKSLIISFCEVYIRFFKSKRDIVLEMLDRIEIQLPDYLPSLMEHSYHDDNNQVIIDTFLKKKTLTGFLSDQSVTLAEIYPKKFLEIPKIENYKLRHSAEEEKRKFDRFYKHALAIYQFRTLIVSSGITNNSDSIIIEICNNIKQDWEFRHYDSAWVQFKLLFLGEKLIEVASFIKIGEPVIESIVESFLNQNQNQIRLRIAIANKLSAFNHYQNTALRLLSKVSSIIEDSSLTSNERVDYLIQSSKILRGFDIDSSKLFFENAIEAISEIDIEAFEQIRCISNLSSIGIGKNNTRLAFEYARFIEFCNVRLSGYDHFPLTEGINGIANLDIASIYPTICRWDHRNFVKVYEQILLILNKSIESEFLSADLCNALLPLNIYYWKSFVSFITKLSTKFDEDILNSKKNSFVQDLLYDLEVNCPYLESSETVSAIYEELQDGRFLKKEVISELHRFHQFTSNLYGKNEHTRDDQGQLEDQDSIKQFDLSEFPKLDIINTSSINDALKILGSRHDVFEIARFLQAIKTSCPSKHYVSHLDAFINIDSSLVDIYRFKQAIRERLIDWEYHPLVAKWKKDNYRKVLRNWFDHCFWDDQILFDHIEDISNYFSINNSDLVDTIADIITDKIDRLPNTAIYQSISFIKNRLNKEDNEILLEWVLSRWNENISIEIGDGAWNNEFQSNGSSATTLVQFIRYILGHPDKRIRWRGVHALRRIINSGNPEILEGLLSNQNSTTCIPFQHKNYTYFWISAKLYLWICIARISQENPSEIVRYKTELLRELEYSELPHVLILYFVKKTCLHLIEYNKTLFSPDETNIIHNVLISKHLPIKEDLYNQKNRKNKSSVDKLRFNFDAMDTLPYWYASLGRCFNLFENDVALIADKYIIEKWGYVGDHHEDDHVAVPDREYGLTSNRHGSLPTVENLRTYYEYHAMFCAAHDLLINEPLSDSDIYSWDDWLKSYITSWDDHWLSDLLDPLPFETKFWLSDRIQDNPKWKDNIDDRFYDEYIGLDNTNGAIRSLIVYGGYTRYLGHNDESVSINSALVSPENSESLQRALQTADSNHNFRIPMEDEELQIDSDGYQLKGWLKPIDSEYEGIDIKDPFGSDLCRHYVVFGKIVDDLFSLNYCQKNKNSYMNNDLVSTYSCWSNVKDRSAYDRFESAGKMFRVDTDFILQVLKKCEMDLIIECTITRHIEDQGYDHKELLIQNNSKLFLIKSDGKIKTLRGRDYKIR